jgi:hypothetical protein
MHFNNHICWYLDNTFCGGLHESEASGVNVQIVAGAILVSFWLVGMLMLFKALMDAGFRIKRQIRRRNMRTGAAVEVRASCLHLLLSSARASFEQAGPAGRRRCSTFPRACRTTSSCFFSSSLAR